MLNWRDDGLNLNIASTMKRTKALGPGLRNVVWFQGCPFHCLGCISPDWIVQKSAMIYDIEELADDLSSDPTITGLTISGGEPFLQPLGLHRLLEVTNRIRPELTIILFSGYRLDQLQKFPVSKMVFETLSFVDLLIDGLYQEMLNNNKGLRGSTNQQFHHLSNRFARIDFEEMTRLNDVRLQNGSIEIAGIPDNAITQILRSRLAEMKVTTYERS